MDYKDEGHGERRGLFICCVMREPRDGRRSRQILSQLLGDGLDGSEAAAVSAVSELNAS